MVTKFKLHRVFLGIDKVVGRFEIRDGEIVFPSLVDKHHCDMFPAGPLTAATSNRISYLIDNKEKSMYLERE